MINAVSYLNPTCIKCMQSAILLFLVSTQSPKSEPCIDGMLWYDKNYFPSQYLE